MTNVKPQPEVEPIEPLPQPTLSVDSQVGEKVEALWKVAVQSLKISRLLRGVGYGLLLLVVIDWVSLFIPPNWMNPVWELQTFGAIIDRVVVPLVALCFIFWGGRSGRSKLERPILTGFSWLSLVIAVLFWLLIPLAIFNTIRIDQQNSQQLATQVESAQTQVQQIQTQLQQVTTPTEMEALLQHFNQTGRAPQIENPQQVEQIKQELATTLTEGSTNVNSQAEAARKNQRLGLLKSSVKWNLGALVAGALFMWIWSLTDWARGQQ